MVRRPGKQTPMGMTEYELSADDSFEWYLHGEIEVGRDERLNAVDRQYLAGAPET